MTILETAEIRQHVQTDLGDAALQRLLDATEGLIEAAIGAVAARTDYLTGLHSTLWATASVRTVTTIKERDTLEDAAVTLSADDYRQQGGYKFVRLAAGTNPRSTWARHVELAYTPEVNTGIIQGVQIELVKLNVVYTGTLRETDGDFEFWHPDNAVATKGAMLPLTNAVMKRPIR